MGLHAEFDINMNYEAQKIIKALREARLAKGMRQTELSKLSGVPQAQISRIEASGVDIRLSSLAALAHALDLEVALVPRKAVPAVKSITRQTSEHPPVQPAAIGKELQRVQEAIRAMQVKIPEIPNLDALRKAHAAIKPLKIDMSFLQPLRELRTTLERIQRSQKDWAKIAEVARSMTHLRNQIIHTRPSPEIQDGPRPAYTLDDDDDA